MGKKKTRHDDYTLSKEEYDKMFDAFYEVESMLRVLGENCTEKGDVNQDLMDAGNMLTVIQGRHAIIGHILTK